MSANGATKADLRKAYQDVLASKVELQERIRAVRFPMTPCPKCDAADLAAARAYGAASPPIPSTYGSMTAAILEAVAAHAAHRRGEHEEAGR